MERTSVLNVDTKASRLACRRARSFSTFRFLWQRPLSGSLLGFLAGSTLATVLGLYWIREEYTKASDHVLLSSRRLTESANHVRVMF